MSYIKITVVDDATINIEGAINETCRRWGHEEREYRVIAISDGTLLKCICDDVGCWRFEEIVEGCATLHHIESDHAVMLASPYDGVFTWVACEHEYALPSK